MGEEFLLRSAFRRLASLDLGRKANWDGPEGRPELLARVETLFVLFDILPRTSLQELGNVLVAWDQEFAEEESVPLSVLRKSARLASGIGGGEQASPRSGQEALERAVRLTQGVPNNSENDTTDGAAPFPKNDAEAQRQCVFGLTTWFNHLATQSRWNYLPAFIPEEPPAPLEEVYVDLFAVPDEEVVESEIPELSRTQRLARRPLASKYAVISAPAMIARTLERCIVVGEPGSGKSTLVQWLAWSTFRGGIPDFEAPLVIKLSVFARSLAEAPQTTLLEFFFQSLGTRLEDWRPAADWLLQVARVNRRFLLLLDGWDEVPIAMRELVRERMAEAEECFVTLVTSRPSGMPRQLRPGTRVNYFHLAGLSGNAKQELVRKLLASGGQGNRFQEVQKRIEEEPDLREMSSNPFLLSLLVRVLAREEQDTRPLRTLGEVYRKVTIWMQEQYNHSADQHDPLRPAHFRGLRQLSYELLLEREPPRYLFGELELAEALEDAGERAVLRSRFVNRIDMGSDEHGFLHATFQEYFAAERASRFTCRELDDFFERTFQSASRLIVLEFLVGLGEQSARHCADLTADRLRAGDRFQQVLYRAARLSAAGRWGTTVPSDIDRRIRELLWQQILDEAGDMSLVKAAVEAYAELDPVDLCRRARQARHFPNWSLNCLMEAVSPTILGAEGVDQLLDSAWGDYAGFDARGGASVEELERIRASLDDRRLPTEDLREAIIHAGAAHDSESVPRLQRLLIGRQLSAELRESILDALGMIGGRSANDLLIQIIEGSIPATREESRLAAAGLRHLPGSRHALDPQGRDQLLRRLASLPSQDARVEFILGALAGLPVRDGAAILEELASNRNLSSSLRSEAISVLENTSDPRPPRKLVSDIVTETSTEVVAAKLQLAIRRGLRIPLPWLQERIAACRDRLQLRLLMKSLTLLKSYADVTEREGAKKFLHRLVVQSFKKNSAEENESAKALIQALDVVRTADAPCLSVATKHLAQTTLVRFAEFPEEVAEGNVLLAAAILEHFRSPALRGTLRAALEMALQFGDPEQGGDRRRERLAGALARSLGETAPGELLEFPLDCEIVQSVLRKWSVERGWLIYDQRITDAEGRIICDKELRREEAQHAVNGLPPELDRLLARRSKLVTNSLLGYLLMVKRGGVCRTDDSLEQIHAEMESRVRGDMDDALSEELSNLFPKRFPAFGVWRRYLNRIETAAEQDPAAEAYLRQHGLYRRR